MRFILIATISLIIQQQIYGHNIANQGLPFSRHFKVSEYKAAHRNWAIGQSSNGFIYFANNDGLLEYNGQEWSTYSIPGNSSIRSIYVSPDDKIYIGAYNEFGYFLRQGNGLLQYTSLTGLIENSSLQTVRRIVPYKHAIYFTSEHNEVYKYNFNTIEKLVLPEGFTDFQTFLAGENIYIFDSRAGLAVLRNDKFYRYHNEMFDTRVPIYTLMELDNEHIILGSRTYGLLQVNIKQSLPLDSAHNHAGKTINVSTHKQMYGKLIYKEFKSPVNNYLTATDLYSGLKLKNSHLAFATLKGGLVIIDQKGKLIDKYTANDGLPDNNILCMFEDREHNLWTASEKGIFLMELYSGYRIYDTNTSIQGNILSISVIDGNIYVGTTAGLYLIDNQKQIDLHNPRQYETITNEYIYILAFVDRQTASGREIFFSSLGKVHSYNPTTRKITDIFEKYGCYTLAYFPPDSSIIFLGHTKGVMAIQKQGKEYKEILKLDGVINHARSIVFDKQNRLYASTKYGGLAVVVFNDPKDINNHKIVWYNTQNGLPQNNKNFCVNVGDSVLILTAEGIYLPEKQSCLGDSGLRFNPYTEFNTKLNNDVQLLLPCPNGDWWLRCENEIVYYENKTKKLLREPFYRISKTGMGAMLIDKKERLWAASYENLYSCESKQLRQSSSSAQLGFSKITIGKDSLLHIIRADSSCYNIGKIDFRLNSLNVQVAFPSYINSENILFSFFLEGIDKTWSEWTNSNIYSISYLPVGKYSLLIKALDGYGFETPPISLEFSISSPWYLTTLAYIVYIVALLAVVYLIVRLRMSKVIREKDKLAQIVKEAIATVEQQKEELLLQTEQLEKTNKELEKLSIVVRQTDNAVVIMDAKGNYEWINEGFTHMYGYTYEDLLNATTRKKIGRNSTLKVSDMINIWYGDKRAITYESLIKHKTGYEIWVQTTLTPVLNDKGDVVKLIAIDTDISKLKRAEKEIKHQTNEAKLQRDIAISQRDEITKSIRYAERIQKAILPRESRMKKMFPRSFILNLPRDIIGGDFYFCHTEGNIKIVAVADCTGHGVPGAFMSIIGISILKEIVITLGFYQPDEILNMLRFNIINFLKQKDKESHNQDGMDISVIAIHKKEKTMYYAGANNPIYVINQRQLTEYHPDKMPVGVFIVDKQPFTLNKIEIKRDDRIYMFSDGYKDQFGGVNGKKLKSAQFKQILIDAQDGNFDTQREYLLYQLKSWRGNLDQVDDVMVVGIDLSSEFDS